MKSGWVTEALVVAVAVVVVMVAVAGVFVA